MPLTLLVILVIYTKQFLTPLTTLVPISENMVHLFD